MSGLPLSSNYRLSPKRLSGEPLIQRPCFLMRQTTNDTREGPHVPRHLPQGGPLRLADNSEIHTVEVADIIMPTHSVPGLIIEQARLHHASFASGRLAKPRSSDSLFEKCDFTASEWTEAHLLRVDFTGCRMLGMQWVTLQARDVLFEDCLCEGAFFVSARLRGARRALCSPAGFIRRSGPCGCPAPRLRPHPGRCAGRRTRAVRLARLQYQRHEDRRAGPHGLRPRPNPGNASGRSAWYSCEGHFRILARTAPCGLGADPGWN